MAIAIAVWRSDATTMHWTLCKQWGGNAIFHAQRTLEAEQNGHNQRTQRECVTYRGSGSPRLALALAQSQTYPVAQGSVRLARLVPRSAYSVPTTPQPAQAETQTPGVNMDRSSSKNNSSEFGHNAAASSAAISTATPWGNNKESPNNEDDSNEDDGDTATPAKVTDPLAPRLTNNEASWEVFHFLNFSIDCSKCQLQIFLLPFIAAARFSCFRDGATTWDLGPKSRVSVGRYRFCRWPGQCLAFSLHLLSEWRRRLPGPLLHLPHLRRSAPILYGTGLGTVSSLRLSQHLEAHLSGTKRLVKSYCSLILYSDIELNLKLGFTSPSLRQPVVPT